MAVLFLAALALCAFGAPDPPRFPTNVYVGITYNSLDKISGAEETFNSDFYIAMYWYDPRVDLENNTFDEATMWYPATDFVNVRGIVGELTLPPQFSYDLLSNASYYVTNPQPDDAPYMDQYWVQYNQRVVGDFSATFNLRQFPFDKQTAQVILESFYYGEDYVKFFPVGTKESFERMVLPDGFLVPEFTIVSDAVLSQKRTFYPPSGEYYDSFQVGIALRRQPQYYLMKIVAGCMLLVLMSISIFVLDVEEADRLMGTITVFLALISFVFVAAADLPKVAYLTKIDQFLFLSFILVTVMALSHMVVYVVNIREERAREKREKEDEEEARASKSPRFTSIEMQDAANTGDATRRSDGSPAMPELPPPPRNTVTPVEAAPSTPRSKVKPRRLGCLKRWRHGITTLRVVRKLDIACMVVFFLVYVIACAVILRNSEE